MPSPTRLRTATKSATRYIDKTSMYKEVVASQQQGYPTEALHFMFYELANRIILKPQWRNYTWTDDMVHDAYMKCIEKYTKFNTETHNNPFAYFTTLIFNHYYTYLNGERRYKELKHSNYKEINKDYYKKYGIQLPNLEGGH